MAYEIIGQVYRIDPTETIPTKSGSAFQKRVITLMQRQYDKNTGGEMEPNYLPFEFTQRGCGLLDGVQLGQTVKIAFALSGRKYVNRTTGGEDFFTSLRGFKIEAYQPVSRQYNQPAVPAQPYQQPQQQRGYQQNFEQTDGLPF